MDARMKADRKRLRAAIVAQLSKRQMTFLELADEVDHIAPQNQVRRELLQLVAQDVVCSLENGKRNRDLFETWDRALERVRARNEGRVHRPTVGVKRAEIVA